MGFRDDREALRAQNEALREELRRAEVRVQAAAEQVRAHEQKDKRDEEELDALRRRVDDLRGQIGLQPLFGAKKNRVGLLLGVSVAASLIVGGLVLGLSSRESPPPKPEVAYSPTDVTPLPDPPSPPEPARAGPRDPGPLDRALFGAVLLHSNYGTLMPGEGCVIDALLGDNADIDELKVHCGEQLVYDSTWELGGGMEMRQEGVAEYQGPQGTTAYSIEYVDQGQRMGRRPQIVVNTQDQTFRVWREGADPFDLRGYVADQSGAVSATPLTYGPTTLSGPERELHVRARVIDKRGPVPPWADRHCELRVRGNAGSYPCRLMLRCGETIVYGAGTSGYAECGVVDGVADTADDDGTTEENTDPIMHFRWEEKRLTISDQRAGELYHVDFRLETADECQVRGRWAGRVITEGSEGPMLLNGRRVSWPDDSEGSTTITTDCDSGAVRFEGARLLSGHFGPDFATITGTTQSPLPGRFFLVRIN